MDAWDLNSSPHMWAANALLTNPAPHSLSFYLWSCRCQLSISLRNPSEETLSMLPIHTILQGSLSLKNINVEWQPLGDILHNIQSVSRSSARGKAWAHGVLSSSLAALLCFSSSPRRRHLWPFLCSGFVVSIFKLLVGLGRSVCYIIWSPKSNLRVISQFSDKHTEAHRVILPGTHCKSIRSDSPALASQRQHQCYLLYVSGTAFLTASSKFTPPRNYESGYNK